MSEEPEPLSLSASLLWPRFGYVPAASVPVPCQQHLSGTRDCPKGQLNHFTTNYLVTCYMKFNVVYLPSSSVLIGGNFYKIKTSY